MTPIVSQRLAGRDLLSGVAIAVLLASAAVSSVGAQPPLPPPDTPHNPYVDLRWNGALADSFQYHRHNGGRAADPKEQSPYRYGFPVASYRWGWFGASRYYPTVVHHRGFNGDHSRWAYRRGY